jgi:hypothetical protein
MHPNAVRAVLNHELNSMNRLHVVNDECKLKCDCVRGIFTSYYNTYSNRLIRNMRVVEAIPTHVEHYRHNNSSVR